MTITKKVRLVFSDLKKNSYKYWDGELYDDGTVISRYGVVGASNPQECNYGQVGEGFLEKKLREKLKKGYEHAKVIMDGPVAANTAAVAKGSLADIAISQIKFSNEVVKRIIRRLAESNVHKITSATSITYNSVTGVLQTPLGVLERGAIDEARNLLVYFNNNKTINDEYCSKIDAYLKLVPRNKGHKLRYEDIFPSHDSIQKESDLLDALENSLDIISKPTAPVAGAAKPIEQVFNLKFDILTDDKLRDRLIKGYERSKKRMHYYDNVKVREVYEVDVVDYNANFNDKLGNIVEAYHGSGQSNILSLLKCGILVSPPSTAQIAGKMFGNGAYFSQTSSKSLGYTLGRWGQSSGDAGWLFVCDVVMGKQYHPPGPLSRIPAGYDSCWALPGRSGVMNDELIVYNTNQIRMRYLLEVK